MAPRHGDDIKAQVWAALVTESPAQVAKRFGVPLGTVKRWAQECKPPELVRADPPREGEIVRIEPDRTEKKRRIVDLAWDYLAASLEAQIAQAKVASDPTYIRQQPAGELAILHGVFNDKVFRLLAAVHQPGDDEAEGA